MKEQAVKRNQILELLDYKNVSTEIGGLRGLKEYIEEISGSIKEERRFRETYGTEMSKGILVCGIPGCGKSLAARFVARKTGASAFETGCWNVDGEVSGRIGTPICSRHSKWQKLCPHVSLFIDELDKAFSGSRKQQRK